jgi:hypothetical protein
MATATPLPDRRSPPVDSVPAGIEHAPGTVRPHRGKAATHLGCRFGRTAGFWLGGVLLGLTGCIVGVCMPYRHPVAVAISALWWGIYLGCLGASLGALLGMWAERPPAASSPRPEGAGKPQRGAA